MENEVSEELTQYFDESYVQFQLVPQHMNQRNATEQAVKEIKNQFISALCTVYTHFPYYIWDRLWPQVNMTLNMLQRYQLKPELSAYEQLDVVNNFECTPLAPLGCNVKIHKKPHKQRTYAPQSVYVCYLGPEVNHYRFYTC